MQIQLVFLWQNITFKIFKTEFTKFTEGKTLKSNYIVYVNSVNSVELQNIISFGEVELE
ncbi:MAG: hypothetical protein H6Q18_1198 [Bacteroidetes bacterium]|nr:hypothetical protein [Bacteroidota bacterium]